ncbi:hypothetical protein [Laceyella putida]|uniref:Uncharacterized protein n=1 Tax=Laceyella putida TaxID=110101 RepID=A0ABW2RGW1_9BACL
MEEKKKKGVGDKLFVFIGIGLFAIFILVIPVLINIGILSLLKNVGFLGINIRSTTGMAQFGIGMILYLMLL